MSVMHSHPTQCRSRSPLRADRCGFGSQLRRDIYRNLHLKSGNARPLRLAKSRPPSLLMRISTRRSAGNQAIALIHTSYKQHLALLLDRLYILLFVIFVDHIDGLFDVTKYEIAMAVICLTKCVRDRQIL